MPSQRVEQWAEPVVEGPAALSPRRLVAVVGFDGSESAYRALDAATQLISGRPGSIVIPTLAKRAHRREFGKSVAKTLNSATFMIDCDQQRRITQGDDRPRKKTELPRRRIVAREQDDAAHRWMEKTLAIFGGELGAGDVEHHRAAWKRGHRMRSDRGRP